MRRVPVATNTLIFGLAPLLVRQRRIGGLGTAGLPGAVHDDIHQASFLEPGLDLVTVKALPYIRHFIFQPGVRVLIHVGDHQPAARAQHAHHLTDRGQRIGGVVQVHIGKDGIQDCLPGKAGWLHRPRDIPCC